MNTKAKIAWSGKILPGKKEEYIARHQNIWPEMVENLKNQGITNYSIFCSGDRLIGYYECEDPEKMQKVKAASSVAKMWADSMKGIMELDVSPETGEKEVFEQIFYLA